MSSPQPSTLFHRDQPVEDIEGQFVQLTPIDTETISNNTVLRSALKTKKLHVWPKRFNSQLKFRFQILIEAEAIPSERSDSQILVDRFGTVRRRTHTYKRHKHIKEGDVKSRGLCRGW